jgi:uncharacterized protein YkwD
VHHLPAGPPLVTRVTGALTHRIRLTGRTLRHRSGRLALGAVASAILTALVLALPVADTTGVSSASLEPSSSSSVTFSSSAGSSSPRLSWTRELQGRSGAVDAVVPPGTSSPAPAPAPAPPVKIPPVKTPPATTPPATTPPPASTAPTAPSAPAVAPVTPAPSPVATPSAPTAPAPPATSPQTPQPADGSGAEAQVLTLVNAERAAAGCRALVADPALAAVARAHSQDMRDRGFFSHQNPDGLSPFDRAERAGISARAENIARGQKDAAAVMDAWMNSSGHRANILNCGLTRLGVGVAEGSGGPWWTQLFA